MAKFEGVIDTVKLTQAARIVKLSELKSGHTEEELGEIEEHYNDERVLELPGCIVEIGVLEGNCLFFLGAIFPTTMNLYGVDSWSKRRSKEHLARFCAEIINRFQHPRITPIRMASAKAAQEWLDWGFGQIGLLHVDGNHSFEACYADIVEWHPNVAVDGHVFGHDWNMPSVRKAVIKGLTQGYLKELTISPSKRTWFARRRTKET